MTHETDAQLREILSLDSVAVVGCSTTSGKDARTVPKYLIDHGYDVIPINPTAEEILGRQSYPSVSAVDQEIDIVNVFRPPGELPGIVDEVLDREDACVLWTQLGIRNDEAADRARDGGVTVIQDKCMRVEHRRLCD